MVVDPIYLQHNYAEVSRDYRVSQISRKMPDQDRLATCNIEGDELFITNNTSMSSKICNGDFFLQSKSLKARLRQKRGIYSINIMCIRRFGINPCECIL